MKKSVFTIVLGSLLLLCCSPEESAYSKKGDKDSIVYLDLTAFNSVSDEVGVGTLETIWDEMHVASCIQGIVNRNEPRIYVNYATYEGYGADEFWLGTYKQPGNWLSDKKLDRTKDVLEVVKKFKDCFGGLVVYDPNVASTSNVASTVAGVEDLIAVRYDSSRESMYSKLRDLGLEVKVWLVNEDGTSKFNSKVEPYEWAIKNYLEPGKCSSRYAAYYIDQFWIHHYVPSVPIQHHNLTNHDFFISQKAFFFDLSPWEGEEATDAPGEGLGDSETFKKILQTIYNQNGGTQFCHIGGFTPWPYKYTSFSEGVWSVGGTHGEVETEWQTVKLVSAYNAYIDADAPSIGILANASFWQHFPLDASYPQKWVTRDELKAKGYLKADGTVDESKKYILVYVGDYDSAAWLSQTGKQMWADDKSRGKVPLNWAISPVLANRAPHVMNYIRKHATANDYFMAADNGAGYLNPGMLVEPRPISYLPSGLDAWAEHCKKYYDQWGLSITGFVIDGLAPAMREQALDCYSKFSPNGVFPQYIPVSGNQPILYNNMPIRRSGPDIGFDNIVDVVTAVRQEVAASSIPFTWFRTVLKTPSWHLQVKEQLDMEAPDIVWMDAPSYMELLRCYLEQHK